MCWLRIGKAHMAELSQEVLLSVPALWQKCCATVQSVANMIPVPSMSPFLLSLKQERPSTPVDPWPCQGTAAPSRCGTMTWRHSTQASTSTAVTLSCCSCTKVTSQGGHAGQRKAHSASEAVTECCQHAQQPVHITTAQCRMLRCACAGDAVHLSVGHFTIGICSMHTKSCTFLWPVLQMARLQVSSCSTPTVWMWSCSRHHSHTGLLTSWQTCLYHLPESVAPGSSNTTQHSAHKAQTRACCYS